MKKALTAGLIGAAGLALAGCGSDYTQLEQSSRLGAAAQECGDDLWQPVFADEGHTLRLQAEDDEIAGFLGAQCIFAQLGMSEATRSQVDSTTLAAGQRSSTEGGLRYTWTYSGFNGLDMVIETAG